MGRCRYVAEGMLQFIASLVPHYIIGMALGAGMYGMFMLCEGFFVVPSNIPPCVVCGECGPLTRCRYWIWGYYLAFHTYSFEIFMYNEFRGWSVETLKV